MTRHWVLESNELWEGEMRQVRAAGAKVVLIRLHTGLVAYVDRCAHLGLPLSRGVLDGDELTCSAHHYVYDAKTGCGLNPCGVRLTSIPVVEEANQIFLELEAAS